MPVQPTIAAGALSELEPILDELGLDFHALLLRVDVSPSDLEDPDRRVSLGAIVEFLELIADEVGDDGVALKLAQKYRAGGSGILGYSILTAPTIRQGLQNAERFGSLAVPGLKVRFDATETGGSFLWEFPENLPGPYPQYVAITVGLLVRTLRLGAGSDWVPLSTALEIPHPVNDGVYYDMFGPDTTFEAPRTFIELSKEVLDLAMPMSDERLNGLLRDLGEYRLSELQSVSDVVDRTQDQIISMLNNGPVSLEMVARDMGQSARSLQRRLKDEGTSFQIVLDKTRRLLARHYLRSPQYTLTEIAFRIGFSEQSAFTRACRRWFNATPIEMRQKLREDAPSVS